MKPAYIFLFLFSMPPLQLYPQSAQPLIFEKIEGLSQNTVYSILKDRQQFMWFATAGGLNRFDGAEMKIYKPSADNKPGTYSNQIIRSPLLEDSLEQIWFSSAAGFYSLNKKKGVFEHRPVTMKGKGEWSINPLLAEGNYVWGGNFDLGVIRYDRTTGKWKNFLPPLPPNKNTGFIKMIKDANHNFWLMPAKGIFFFNRNKNEWSYLFTDKQFTAIGSCNNHVYLVSTDKIYCCDINTLTLQRLDVTGINSVFAFRVFCADKHFNTWAGDEAGNIYCRQKNQNYFEWRGNTNTSGDNYPVYSIFADDNDILWTGSEVTGVSKAKIYPPFFSKYPSLKSDPPVFIHSLYEDEKQTLWLGTFRKGLLCLDKKTGFVKKADGFPLFRGTENNSISLLKNDSQNNLWVAAYNGLYVRKNGEQKFTQVPIERPSSANTKELRAFAMYELGDTLYMSSQWGVFGIYKTGSSFSVKYYPEGGGYYYDIYIDSKKNFWLASEVGVFKRKDINCRFKTVISDTVIFKNVSIKSFTPDTSHQLLWICTASGLIAYHLPSGQYKFFAEAEGIGNSHVYGGLQYNDELWLSTNGGLTKAMVTYTNNEVLPKLQFINYTSGDGLIDDEFNSGAFYKSANNELTFGTIRGVIWFKPGNIAFYKSVPYTVITSLLVNDEPADSMIAPEYLQQLSLPYNRNNLFIKFRGIDYSNPDKVTYSYRLKGWDKDWVYSGHLNQVRYNHLSPGNYLFEVKVTDAEGNWYIMERNINITIHPPFWKTWWFISLATLLLLSIISFIVRYISQNRLKEKIRQLEKQRALDLERQRISREMHDDIGAGLTQIALMTESVKNKLQTKELDDIAGTSRKLVGNMSEIIWSLNQENKSLEHLCAYLREQLNKQLEYTDTDYIIDLPHNGKDIILSNEQRRNILLVTKEIVNNAVKYSGAKSISVNAVIENSKLVFKIADNGRGFDTSASYSGNGLRNIKYRVEELGGKLQIISSVGNGAVYIYSVPL